MDTPNVRNSVTELDLRRWSIVQVRLIYRFAIAVLSWLGVPLQNAVTGSDLRVRRVGYAAR